MKRLIIIFFVIKYAAIAQLSKGGKPKSFQAVNSFSVPAIKIYVANSILDSLAGKFSSDYRLQFGYAVDTNINVLQLGKWDTLSNGDKICRIKIHCINAYSVNLIFDNFWLAPGSELFIYNEDTSVILGAFVPELNNHKHRKFATDIVKGSSIIIDYYEPSYSPGSILNISKVIYEFVDIFSGTGLSAPCNVDVNCPIGDAWCVEKRTVSMILVDNNTALCTGCLINNTNNDLTPYYLTANHCLQGDEDTWIFRFKYWSPTCNQGANPNDWISLMGASVKAYHGTTDFALLLLHQRPISGMGIMYAGWDRNVSIPEGAVGIHHPSGDVMKISVDDDPLVPVGWFSNSPLTHWRATFDVGIVQHGSSGSPLFNTNHRVIGQLHGNQNNICFPGDNVCFCQQTPVGEYGRFDISWIGGNTPQTGLKNWLDPNNSGYMTLTPTSPTVFLINKTLTSIHKFASINKIHIEGNVATNGNMCPPSNVPFTTEPGANVTIKAKRIIIKPGTHLKFGSKVRITATYNISCADNIVSGDYVDIYCNAQVSAKFATNTAKQNTEDITNKHQEVIIYPNPTQGIINVKFSKGYTEYFSIKIYSATGKLIRTIHNTTHIDISELPQGIYFLFITTGSSIYRTKILKL